LQQKQQHSSGKCNHKASIKLQVIQCICVCIYIYTSSNATDMYFAFIMMQQIMAELRHCHRKRIICCHN
jgi:hypothetical protein